MTPNHRIKGIWPVLVTPYQKDLRIDVGAYREIIQWYMGFALGGLYANCLSSEMYELDEAERLLLIKEAVKTADGKLPVAVTGNFGQTSEEHLRFCQKAADLGADVVMLTVPEFIHNDEELKAYYLYIAEHTQVPLGLYECPYPRSYHLGIDLIVALAKTGRFFAYKETSCRIEKIRLIARLTKDTPLALLQANVPFMIEALRAGAEGSMNIVANWLPDLTVAVAQSALTNLPLAERLHRELCAMEMAQRSVHPTGVKYLMHKRGLPIQARTRYKKSLTPEEAYSLDALARLWFEADGSLRLFKENFIS
ncbi:MAG: dihydrodipicolinate synthase family protein [Bacteroidetes bacterium]|nr:MAG: dihydrodipicolinate synthase family protein [Bacteroidota bacterium]